ncbi:nucleolar protein 8 [Aulostomus maculatus]
MTVLNKSKWKGGTLQIEPAKESVLHRLAEERQAAEEQRLQQPEAEDKRKKLLDSLSKAGVENFTMKAAVPGTEIPGHKDWVVSKFGRVLPILQLRCQKGNRARSLKYDPSKYSHNIRRLNPPTADPLTPVTQLTWEVEGGDDDISKKRRGEFPPFEPSRPKKSRTDVVSSHHALGSTRFLHVINSENHLTNGRELPTDCRAAQRRGAHLPNSDDDSDEEIRRLVAAQQTSHGAQSQDVQEDNLEVVGLDYLVKCGNSRQQQTGDEDDYDSADTDELFASTKLPPRPPQEKPTQPAADSVSGDTTERMGKVKKKSPAGEQEDEFVSADSKQRLSSRKLSLVRQEQDSEEQGSRSEIQSMKMAAVSVAKTSSSESDDDDDDEESEAADSESDSDYEAMFSNVTHLEISLADLQKVAEEFQKTEDSTPISPRRELVSGNGGEPRVPKKGTMPEEILAALLEDDSSEDEKKTKKKKKRKGPVSKPLPAFQGTMVLSDEPGRETERQKKEEERGKVVKKQKLDPESPQLNHRATDKITSRILSFQGRMSESGKQEGSRVDEEEEKTGEAVKSAGAPKVVKMDSGKPETSSASASEEDEQRLKASQIILTAKAAAKTAPSSSSEEDEDQEEETVKEAPVSPSHSESTSSEEEEEEEEGEEVQAHLRVPLAAEEEEERQRKANMRRLAAVQQKQKEAEEHKKLIQGALANLDAPTTKAGKHIVFGSDDEGDDEEEQPTTSLVTASKKTLLEDSQSEDEAMGSQAAANKNVPAEERVKLKSSGPRLFGGSDDEEDGDEEEDESRFDIRPQFEGRAGQKLMELQSRFGTDERFRMDSRFLEEEEGTEEGGAERKRSVTEDDEALEEERKKNLSILQSVLGSSQQTCSSKTAGKAKTFRDVSVLHYDPSREEHSSFETKTDETKKESKSARKKKREEAQKLPDVSKEIYYDVSGDLKALFGVTKKDEVRDQQMVNWDQEEEEEEDGAGKDEEQPPLPSLLFTDPNTEKEESSEFKFSFFSNDAEAGSGATDEYKVENIQAPKVSWQQDPRLQDSSSEEDEEEQEEDEEKICSSPKATEDETPPKKQLFFFHPDDSRLTEGPRWFCRSSQLEEQREEWEGRRSALRQEYRKKHKDARRKLKSSQRS